MTDRYLSSVTGNAANTGLDTWAGAKATLADIATTDAAGDTIFIDPAHTEAFTASVSATFEGTEAAPTRLICANTGAAPPNAVASGALISGAAATVNLSLIGSLYARGITFRAGSTGSATLNVNTGDEDIQVYEDCTLELYTNQTTARLNFGLFNTGNSSMTVLRNSRLKFNNVGHYLTIHHKLRMQGGGLAPGSSAISSLMSASGAAAVDIEFDSVDLSGVATACDIARNDASQAGSVTFRDCRMPDSWSGKLFATDLHYGGLKISMFNTRVGSGKIPFWTHDGFGQCKSYSTVYRTNGFVEDATPLSASLTGVVGLSYPSSRLEGVPCQFYTDAFGSPITRYLEIVHDSQGAGAGGRLLNTELGALVVYPGGSTEIVPANPLAAGTAIADSSESWATPGMVTPVKQRLAVTFTPTAKGVVRVIPLLFAAKQIFYCLKLGV